MPDTPQQTELPLEAPPLPEDAPFLPARMVNEYVYCPRLAYLEWVQGEWAESADTVEGTHVHRRVDREDRPLPSAEVLADQDRPHTRSVTLSSRRLGLVAAGGRIPAPLRDSPKCPRCSLVGICLPDEVNHFRRTGATPRPIAVRHDEMLPLYVQANNARLAKKAETITITEEDGPTTTARLIDVSQVVLMGNVRMTTPCLHELMRREIPVTWHSYGGWFLGHTMGLGHKNVELREAQYRASFTPAVSLAISRSLVAAKVRNSRTMMRRNWRGEEQAREQVLNTLRRLADRTRHVSDTSALLGLEGEAAAVYFRAFAGLLGPRAGEEADDAAGLPAFRFDRRNRRPPTDPVNALLSFAYAMLTRTFTVTLSAIGFDVYRGFYHRPRYGRPALALDLMEPFRSIVADSTVLQAINNGEVRPDDFLHGGAGTALKPAGRKRFIAAFERRLAQETTHPIFGYRLTMRRLIEVQGRLFGRFLMGEIKDYPHYLPR